MRTQKKRPLTFVHQAIAPLVLFASLFVTTENFASSAFRCGDVLEKAPGLNRINELTDKYSTESQKLVVHTMYIIADIPADLALGLVSPQWQHFEMLTKLKHRLKGSLEGAREELGESAFVVFLYEIDQSHRGQNSKFKELLAKSKIPAYGPTDYGMKLAFRRELESMNSMLPKSLKFEFPALPMDLQKKKNNEIAVEIVREQEDSVRRLYSTSGYKNVVELVETVREKGNPQVKRAMDQLLSEDFEFAIWRPVNSRWWLPKVGFHNQFVTGSSKGYKGARGRNVVESSRLGVELQDYENQDNDLKPKYGMLLPKITSGVARNRSFYGDDLFIIDKDKVRSRTTWTPGDSLNPFAYSMIRWDAGNSIKPKTWDQTFVPWSQRALLAPIIQGYEKTHLAPQPGIPDTMSTKFSVGEGIPNLTRQYGNSEYVELQYWGELNLDHVKAFVFTNEPPAGEFLQALRARNISIYKALNSVEHVLWTKDIADSGGLK